MNLTWIDWVIVLFVLAAMLSMVFVSSRLTKSVTDFLAAGRTGGRYVISMFQGTAALGAITIVGALEMNYVAGFNLRWWEIFNSLVLVGMSVTGWVVYRFRQTRALTMAQFFEIRYSRRFRIFAGFLAFISGIVNFGIFPAVSARFFLYFCGLPQAIEVVGISVPTFAVVVFLLIFIPLTIISSGGQIAVMFTDFVQGIFINIVFVLIVIVLLTSVDWSHITQAVSGAPPGASLVNPFRSGNVKDFNFWYFFVGMIGLIYTKLSWQGNQAFNVSAKSPHEAKMADVLTNWRMIPQWGLFLVFVPVVAYTVVHHGDFVGLLDDIRPMLDSAGSETIRSQIRIPLILSKLLPAGLMGAFAAIMLAAAIACHNTYLHSWGSIFIQDVVMPLRKQSFEPAQHLRHLRCSFLGVGVLVFFFSLIFQQSEYVFLFFAITGSIFVGGSGAVIIGGLYWKRGTTGAAWSAMATGSVIAVGGIVIQQLVPGFPVNGQMFWGLAMAGSIIAYVVVSLSSRKKEHPMDRLLHRGAYMLPSETGSSEKSFKGWRVPGMTPEFSRGDRIIYIATYAWTCGWVIVFLAGTVYALVYPVPDSTWLVFWKSYIWIYLSVSIVVVGWFTIGGVIDVKNMIKMLTTMKRDHRDTGFVMGDESSPDDVHGGRRNSDGTLS